MRQPIPLHTDAIINLVPATRHLGNIEAARQRCAAPQRLRLDVAGVLAEAFATDLDGDAVPELLLWTRSSGSSAEGEVRGWRFDAAGSATAIQVPALDDEATAKRQ